MTKEEFLEIFETKDNEEISELSEIYEKLDSFNVNEIYKKIDNISKIDNAIEMCDRIKASEKNLINLGIQCQADKLSLEFIREKYEYFALLNKNEKMLEKFSVALGREASLLSESAEVSSSSSFDLETMEIDVELLSINASKTFDIVMHLLDSERLSYDNLIKLSQY